MQSAIKKVVISSGAKCVVPSTRGMSYQRNYRLATPPIAIYKRNTALVCVNNTAVRRYASWDKKEPDQKEESAMFKKGKEAAEAALNVAQKSTEFMSESAQKAYAAGKETLSNLTGSAGTKGTEAKHAAEEAFEKGKHSAQEAVQKGKHTVQEAAEKGKAAAHSTFTSGEAKMNEANTAAKGAASSGQDFVRGAVDATKDAINHRGEKD